MQCKDLSTALVCFVPEVGPPQTLVAHYEYRSNNLGGTVLHAVRYTDAAGVVVNTVGGTVTAGACALTPPDVEFEQLCDLSAAGVVTEFIRRSITSFDASGNPTTSVADFGLDKVTPYVPTGTVVACERDCDVVAPVGLVNAWG